MTNHHVGSDCIAKLGRSDHDYHRDQAAYESPPAPTLQLTRSLWLALAAGLPVRIFDLAEHRRDVRDPIRRFVLRHN